MKRSSGKKPAAKAGADEQRFLSNLGEVLASALDERAMLSAIARLMVPRLGDVCLLDIIDDDGSVRRVDNTLADWHLAPTPGLRAGESLLIPDLTPSSLGAITADPAGQAAIRGAGIRSLLLLPLIGRGRLLGVLTLGMTRPDQSFGERDPPLLEDVASVRPWGPITRACTSRRDRQAARATTPSRRSRTTSATASTPSSRRSACCSAACPPTMRGGATGATSKRSAARRNG